MARRQLNICYLTKKSNAITRLAESLRPAYPKIAAWQTSNPEELFSDKRPDIIIADPDFRTSELPKSALYVIKQKEAQKFIKDSSVQFITEDELGTHAFVRAIGNIIEQERLLTQLQESSIKDELTGLYNKKFMLDILGKEVKKSIRYHTPLSILFVGADGMKKINEHGHGIGDQVIMDLGIIISQSVREVDVAGRFDGDEFIAILPETTLENSSHVCKRIQYTTKNFAFANGEPGLAVTVSMGVSELEGNLRSREDLVESARQALAGAKKRGPGSICTWEEAKTKADPVKENAAIISSVRHQIALLSEETEKNHYKNLMKLFESMSSYKRRQHHSERVAFYSEMELGIDIVSPL